MPTFTGRITRIAFIKGSAFKRIPPQLIIEIESGREVRTFIAYGSCARSLRGYLVIGKMYTIDYTPSSGGEFDGEAVSATDRNP